MNEGGKTRGGGDARRTALAILRSVLEEEQPLDEVLAQNSHLARLAPRDRGFARLLQENSLFVLLAASGLLVQFGLQAFINMASTLHLMPTKGMTLPFLSYGGSSLMALALGMGMLLALTRRRVGGEAGT